MNPEQEELTKNLLSKLLKYCSSIFNELSENLEDPNDINDSILTLINVLNSYVIEGFPKEIQTDVKDLLVNKLNHRYKDSNESR